MTSTAHGKTHNAESVVTATGALARDKGLTLAADVAPGLPHGVADERRVTQVLLNLVGNAIKFTEKGEVVVTVEVAEGATGAANLHFRVRDSGIGIPADRQTQIFEAFSQVDSSTTRRFGGTGLGLTISSQLVALMGGRVWVESELGKGSTFFFTLPKKFT